MICKIELEEFLRLKKRFIIRARTVLWARLAFSIISAIALLLNHFFSTFFLQNPLQSYAWICWSLVILGALVSHFFVSNEKHGRRIYFLTLNLDLTWGIYLIVFSNGLESPLMVIIPIYTFLFSIIFPSPVTLLSPLLVLPIITALNAILFKNHLALPNQIGHLCLFGILNAVVIYITNFILSHEEKQSREIFQLERQLKRLAILEERNRISREMHDGLGGTLSSLIIQAEYLLSICQNYPHILKELRELKCSAEEAIDEMRRSICMMRNEFDFIPQLKNCCITFSTRHKLPTHLNINGEPAEFSPEKQLTIFRIMQECLNNTSKHAHAKSVDVQIQFSDKAINMSIKDDGQGFNPNIIPKNHFGLLNIQERAKKIGGDVTIESSPGKGTCIHVRLND